MASHMKKLGECSHTGSDELHFYDIGAESGGEPLSHVRIVHLQEWADLVGEIEAEDMEKYNVVCHDVCVYGYDNFVHGADSYEAKHDMQPKNGVGHSVHASLSSFGYELKPVGLDVFRIEQTYDGTIIAQGALTDPQMALVIAECMYGCGAGDRVLDESGNNRRALLRDARRA